MQPLAVIQTAWTPLWPVLITLPLVAFLVWMFADMTRNVRLPNEAKYRWAFLFLVLNVFAAGWYYLTEYRRGRSSGG